MMKKYLSLLLALCLLLSLAACSGAAAPTETTAVPTAAPTETTALPEATASPAAMDALNGKRVLFIGNSYTFWGMTVLVETESTIHQQTRDNDKGLFYQLCKANGMDVAVTDWTFGGHNVTDIMSHSCLYEKNDCMGTDHLSCLKEPYFDYVCIQPFFETEYTGDLVSHLQPTVDFFRQANPNVKFLLLIPHMTFESNFVWYDSVPQLQESGFIICNWGGMIQDIIHRRVAVPGATEEYWRPSFVIGKHPDDGYHQNILAGYLTALMVYCAITGDSAVGQPYMFCDDTSLSSRFGLENYRANNYIHEPYTNFIEIFNSQSDMQGLQTLTDQYLTTFNGGN